MPEAWRFQDFSVFIMIKDRFKTMPLGYEDSPLYSLKDERKEIQREFVNWKKVFTYFLLLSSYIQSRNSIIEYCD